MRQFKPLFIIEFPCPKWYDTLEKLDKCESEIVDYNELLIDDGQNFIH